MLKLIKISIGAILVAAVFPSIVSEAQTKPAPTPANSTLVYVGTYTGEKSKGIYFFRQSVAEDASQNVTLVPLGLAAETPSPSFLEIDTKRRLLFAVNETGEFQGKQTGGVSAFSIDSTTGKLKLINQRSSMGKGPCHLVLDRAGKNLLVANYSSGNAAVLPVAADGTLGEATDVIQHSGKSVNPQRQQGPHAHCAVFDPAGKFAFVCDLGLDKVMIYRFDAEKGKLTPNDPPFATLKPGAGPRHMVFRQDGRFAYVNNEMDSSVTTFAYDASKGALKEVQTLSALPTSWQGSNTTAEIEIHPSGKYLFVSNRGHNSVAQFTIDAAKGTLTWVEAQSTGGANPRHFKIDAAGKYMAIANQSSNTVLGSRIDAGNGRLKPSGVFADAPTPVCVKFLPPKETGR
ncbi:MAG TPA: lactonase family protein [Bryobacteraceae bacterium]|jgi:6-phosphogluconolactonase|nr:lactonase family protein [Bryobacteraceae bacterium]